MKFKFTFFSLFIVMLVSCQEKKTQPLEEGLKSSITEETKKLPVYNEEFLAELKTIRETQYTSDEKSLKIDTDVTLSFPSKYNIKKQNSAGTYMLFLSDSLIFDIEDEHLVQYQINYDNELNEVNGKLNILKKDNITYNIKETISELKQTTGYYNLIDADESGYIYEYFEEYHILRYFKINDTHYAYDLDFKNLKECVQEFDRSKKMIQ